MVYSLNKITQSNNLLKKSEYLQEYFAKKSQRTLLKKPFVINAFTI